MGNRKNIRNVLGGLNDLGLQTNSLIPFLKASVTQIKAMIFIASVTVKRN